MILSFDKPKKVRPTAEHNRMHMSDSGVDGTFVPNMSQADNERWKAKHIKGENERIEIRVSINGVQVAIVVRKYAPLSYPKPYTGRGVPSLGEYDLHRTMVKKWQEAKDNIKISMNGALWLGYADWNNMVTAIREAEEILARS